MPRELNVLPKEQKDYTYKWTSAKISGSGSWLLVKPSSPSRQRVVAYEIELYDWFVMQINKCWVH